MRLWERVLGRRCAPPSDAADVEPGPPSGAPDLAALESDDTSEVEAALRRCAGTSLERRALQAVASRAERAALPEAVRVVAAAMYARRGEMERALGLLRTCIAPESLLLAADVETECGRPDHALALVERVLVADLDAPGALERRRRLRAGLGAAPDALPRVDLHLPDLSGKGYSVRREIARGGSAAVFEAVEHALGRPVAVKAYHSPRRDRSKLVNEGRTAARLAGPGVIRLFDVDADAGFLVLQWAAGGSLAERLRADPAAVAGAMDRWWPSLVAALARVHRGGFVHGDLNSGNVLFTAAGEPLLADFGSAQRASDASADVDPSTGTVRGGPSAADDILALGALVDEVVRAVPTQVPERWRRLAARLASPARPGDATQVPAEAP